tara:strand:+ start:80008 stop:81054 length:1047 start_codon:yes stop_codon:yes gene_type:complete
MHLERIMQAFLEVQTQFEVLFVHHTAKHYKIYDQAIDVVTGRNPLKLAKKLNELNVHLVHYNPLSLYSPIYGCEAIKCATIHGDAEHFLPQEFSLFKRAHAKYLIPHYARKMDHIFTVSNATTRYVRDCYGISEDQITETPNACDARFRVYEALELAELKFRYTSGQDYMLTVCNYSARKNPWVMLNAFRRISAERPDFCFIIVGNGWDDLAVRSFVEEYSLTSKVIFPGFVPTEEVPKLMNLATCLVFPSLYEGFGMPNLEAMACGCPVITSSVFSIPEVVGDAAQIMENHHDADELAASVMHLIDSPQKRLQMRERGLKNVQRYSWRESAERLNEQYLKLVSGVSE